ALATYVALVGRLQRAARATAEPAQRGDLPDGGRHVRSPLKIKKASRTGGLQIGDGTRRRVGLSLPNAYQAPPWGPSAWTSRSAEPSSPDRTDQLVPASTAKHC